MNKVKVVGVLLAAALVCGCEKAVEAPAATQSPVAQSAAGTLVKVLQTISEKRPAFIEAQPFELGGKCNMETLNGNPWGAESVQVDPKIPLVITGWGVDDTRKLSPKAIALRVQDAAAKEYYATAEPVLRTDVAEYFKEGYFASGGYKVEASLAGLPSGAYAAMIVMNVEGKSILCASGRTIVIPGAGS